MFCSVFGRQESAPTDVSGLIGAIYDRMNEDLDDVLKLEINYVGGVIHRYVRRLHLVVRALQRLLPSIDPPTEFSIIEGAGKLDLKDPSK